MAEQRIIGGSQKIGGQRPGAGASPDAGAAPAPAPAPRKTRRAVLVAIAAVLVLGAAAWFLLRPAESAEAAPEPEVELGAVQTVEPVSINLADGRYLRLGLGLQLTLEVEEDVDPSKALDRAIALFSQRPVSEISTPEGREALKSELAAQLEEAYEGEVVAVYFTNYVYQ